MTRAHAWLVVLTCGVLAAWAGRRGPASPTAPRARVAAVPAELSVDVIRGHADRLRTRLSSPPPFTAPRRNPFRFHEPAPPPVTARRAEPALRTALGEPPGHPEMKLIGVAEDAGQGAATTRTAIVSAMSQLFFVKEGERVLGRYEVVRITADAAQLRDPDGSLFTLALR
jgi:hypothetical protein